MIPTINDIKKNPAESRKKIIHQGQEIDYLKEQNALLTLQLYGKKSEKFTLSDPDQLTFLESQAEAEIELQKIIVPAHNRKKSGRKPLPEELPRVEVIHDLTDEEKICSCGTELSKIGEESSEQLDYIPAKLEVIRHIRPKYTCKACENFEGKGPTIKIAPVPKQMIPKSIASARLIAQIVVAKFVDALPFYRQEKQIQRLGFQLSRNNMINWIIQLGIILNRLLFLLHQELLLAPLIHIDETTLQVLKEPGRSPSSKSYMWVMRGGASVYFHYSPTRASSVAQSLLKNYSGFVMTDGYSGYNFIDPKKHAACWAHARRKFADVVKVKGKKSCKTGSAEIAIDFIRKLYQLEREAKENHLSAQELLKMRQEKSRPLLEEFHQWLWTKKETVLPKSLLGKAIAYSLNRWDGLSLFLDHPEIPLDNNLAENAIRPFVIGRKNFLFCDTQKGATANAALYSLIETAKANNLNPTTYLKALFERFPYAENDEQLRSLLPQHIDLTKN